MHLAQLNIARMRAPLDNPIMAGFVSRLAEINKLAEESTGFVWRLKDESGDATSIRVFDDPMLILNLTVWESIAALRQYVYKSQHADLIRMRKEWFEPMDTAHLVLWWIEEGHIPALTEAKHRLEYLQTYGTSEKAFNFKDTYDYSISPK